MEPEAHRKPIRYHEIDLLRFLAALSVMLYHFTFAGYHYHGLSPVQYPLLEETFKYGFLGVELFFMISGYVVLMSAQGKTLGQFFTSRVSRLYPAFWVACTICFVVVRLFAHPLMQPGAPVLDTSLGHYFVNMTMLHGFVGIPNLDGVYWTLTYEIVFYFLIAVMLAFGWFKHLVMVLTVWLGYCLVASLGFNVGPFAFLFFPQYAPFFIAGMVFFLLQQAHKQAIPWELYLLLLACYGLSLQAAVHFTRESAAYYQHPFSPIVGCMLVSVFFGLFLLIVYRKINIGQAKWLTWAGALTYPMYLGHHNIGYVVLQRLGNRVNNNVLLVAMLTGVFLLAFLIHVVVERRYSKILGRKVQQLLDKV